MEIFPKSDNKTYNYDGLPCDKSCDLRKQILLKRFGTHILDKESRGKLSNIHFDCKDRQLTLKIKDLQDHTTLSPDIWKVYKTSVLIERKYNFLHTMVPRKDMAVTYHG